MRRKINFFSGLRTRMLIMFLILTVIPVLFIGIIIYVKSYQTVLEQSQQLALKQAKQITMDIDRIFESMDRFNQIGELESTTAFLLKEKNTSEEVEDILKRYRLFRESIPYGTNIIDMNIYGTDGTVLNEFRGMYKLDSSPINKKLFSTPNDRLIEPAVENGFSAVKITTPIQNPDKEEIIGFMELIIDAFPINKILSRGVIGDFGSFHIEARQPNTILFPQLKKTDPDQVWEGSREGASGTFIHDKVFTVYETSDNMGWRVIGNAPVKDVMRDVYQIRSFFIISMFLSIVTIIYLYFVIFSKFISSIRTLKEKMGQASKGDLDVKVTDDKSNPAEITELNMSFNRMLTQIKSLMNQSIHEQKQLKLAEFRAMQEQINPHFLYNTLETIVWMSEAKKHEQVIDVTKALSNFFRISLSKGKDLISIRDEIEHVRNYLFIQKVRYEDILEVTYHINEDIFQYSILKLTIQPIVENAIYHGIKNKRGKGFALIKGDINAEGYICIDIIDNGIGMTEQRLEEIRTQLSRNEPINNSKSGLGMLNVHQRIRTYYGEPFGLTINSWYGSGTRVCLMLPQQRGEIEHEKSILG